MPNRYVREGIIESESVNALSWQAEVFYRRVINRVDDFGRFTAHASLLRASIFPLQIDKVRETDMSRLLAECEKAGLLFVYATDGKKYLALRKWENGRSTVSKFPEPPPDIAEKLKGEIPLASGGKFSGSDGGVGDVGPPAPNLGAAAPEIPPTPTPTPTPTESHLRARGPAVPVLPTKEQAMAQAPIAGIDPKAAECWWLDCESRGLSPSGYLIDAKGHEVRNWQAAMTSYGRKWQSNDEHRAQRSNKPSNAPITLTTPAKNGF